MVELAIVSPCLAYVQDDFRDTALVAAVGQDHLHVAEILVENGADVNYRNKVRALHKYNIYIMHNVANDN